MKNFMLIFLPKKIKVLTTLLLLFTVITSSFGQVRVPFTQRTSQYTPSKTIYSVKGDFTMIGNTNLTLENYSNSANNSNNSMEYVDVDGDRSTYNSSSATLALSTENGANPECSNIIYAGLYWTGRSSKSLYRQRRVKFKGPNDSSYHTLVADANDIRYPGDDNMFVAYKEVTDLVRANGLGEYFVADIALTEGNGGATGYYGGWGMVVVYENSKMNWRDITIFDGYAYVQGNVTADYEIPVSGFNAVQTGDVNIKLGLMAGEGDRGISGDYFQIIKSDAVNDPNPGNNDWQSLSHSGNSTGNFFNSSINTGGNARNPSLTNNTGLDIAMFDLPNSNKTLIDNGQTQTKFRYGSTQDTYIIFSLAMSVDAYVPESEGLLSVTHVNGNTPPANVVVEPGDVVEYKIEVRNKGTEPIENAQLVIPIPFTSEYVPGSLNYGTYISSFDADPPYYDPSFGATGAIVWNIDYLPLHIDINTLLADISFELKATEDCTLLLNDNCEPKIVIVGGSISGTGVISGTDYELSLIQGYQEEGICQGEPNTDPIEIDINADQYIADNCTNVTLERDFFYCSFEDSSIPISELASAFPPGTRFYDSYPVTPTSIEYTTSNPFPATLGVSYYYGVPPGDYGCHYAFTIEVKEITTSPSVSDVEYCVGDTATPLVGQSTDSNYVVVFYPDNDPNTIGQTTLIPDTSSSGVYTYYASEGPTETCVNSERIPITVTVYDEIQISLENIEHASCVSSSDGSIDISVSGGTGNYTYDWDYNGEQNPDTDTQDLSNLSSGNYTVVVSDIGSNCSATASFTIDVVDSITPTIVAPTNISVEGCSINDITNGTLTTLPYSESITSISVEQFTNEGGGFSEDNVQSITYQDTSSNECPIIVTRTFTITDMCGAVDTDTQTIYINDTTAPTLVGTIPSGQSNLDLCFDEIPEGPSEAEIEALFSDNCSNVNVIKESIITGDDCNWAVEYKYTVQDDCGNTYPDINIFYNGKDNTAPTFNETLPVDITVECDAVPTAETLTATDNCGSANVSFEETTAAGNCSGNYVLTRTWTATDECGNDTVHTQTITVQDTTAPTFNETLPTDITVECDAVPTAETLTASDNCGSADVTFEETTAAGNCSGSYTLTRTWTATDECGNDTVHTQIITVEDTTTPTFNETLPTDITVECDAVPTAETLTATDNCGIANVSFEETTNAGSCSGSYTLTRTWTATDECGNDTVHTQVITVEDTTAPILVSEFEEELNVVCNEIPEVLELAFEDACSDSIDVIFDEISTSDGSLNDYAIIRNWIVTDDCGNQAVYTQTINVLLENTLEGLSTDLCIIEDFDYDLFNLLSGDYDTNGVWTVTSGNATIDGNYFNPSSLLDENGEFINEDLGEYIFTYTVTAGDCPSVTDVTINITDDCVVYPCGRENVVISKAVTVNGDSFNEYFTVTGVEECGFTIELQIFNRWGAKIYESSNYQNDWNGQSHNSSVGNSNFVPTGTYYYVINLKNSGLKPFTGPIYVGTK